MKKHPLSLLAFLLFMVLAYSSKAQVVISEFNASEEVELINLGTTTVDVSNYQLCQFPDYDRLGALTVLCGSLMLGPGEELSVKTSGINLSGADGELGLYTNSSFDNAAGMIDYVEWGSANHTRSSVAVTAGIWTAGTSAPAFGNDESLIYDGAGNSPADWALGASTICVADANLVMLSDSPTLGFYLSDGDGRTLYFFTRDVNAGASACTGGCPNTWPVFYAENLVVDNGLEAEDFTSFMRADGAMQTAYKGWPLYYFANDANAGETNGEAFNNVWFVAKPDYHIMLMNNTLVGHDGVTYTGSYEPGEEVVQYFVDAYGRTIYIFIPDKFNTNTYTLEDFSNNPVWPIYEEVTGEVPSTLDASLFDVIDVFGRQQLTYKGWPLYYFVQDTTRGQNKGVSFPAPGIWPVAVAGLDTAPLASAVTDAFAEKLKVGIGPNPTRDWLNVKIEAELTGRALSRVISLQGAELQQHAFQLGNGLQTENIDVSELPAGMYIFLLEIDRQRAVYQKFLKN